MAALEVAGVPVSWGLEFRTFFSSAKLFWGSGFGFRLQVLGLPIRAYRSGGGRDNRGNPCSRGCIVLLFAMFVGKRTGSYVMMTFGLVGVSIASYQTKTVAIFRMVITRS